MPYSLSKILTKSDALFVMDIAHESLGKNSDLQSVFDKLKIKLPFNKALAAQVSISGPGKPFIPVNAKFNIWVYNISNAFTDFYVEKKLYLIDPVGKELLRTFELVDIRNLIKKNPPIQYNQVHQLSRAYHMSAGFSYGIRSFDYSTGSCISFFDDDYPLNTDPRTRYITMFLVPFLVQLFNNTLHANVKPKITILSRRELEILQWLKEGKSSWEISMILNIGESTVNFHVTNIMRKLNATKRTQAVALAIAKGLIEF